MHQQTGRAQLRSRAEGARPPKKTGEGPTVAALLLAERVSGTTTHRAQVGKLLTAIAGSLRPQELRAAHALELSDAITRTQGYATSTKVNRCSAARLILRWLWEYHGAPKLDNCIQRTDAIRPRNVTASADERDAIFAAAKPHLKLWLLLCSDLAIRSGTAARLGPEHYDPMTGTLHFTTKKGARQTMPVTKAIRDLLYFCDQRDPLPFVRQLQRMTKPRRGPAIGTGPVRTSPLNCEFAELRRDLGITRKLTPHDFRRTTAIAMLEHTRDVRDVQALLGHRSLQSTIWYLDHDLRPVSRHTLELIKRPNAAESEEQTA